MIPTAFQIQGGVGLDDSVSLQGPEVLRINNYRPYTDAKNKRKRAIMAANAVLRKDQWKQYDAALIAVAQKRLRAVGDLMSLGLVYRPGTGISKTVLEWEDISDMTEAAMDMDGLSRTPNDRQSYETRYLPLPIIHKDWQLNERFRSVEAGGQGGVDTTKTTLAGRKVADYIENMLINGSDSYSYGGGTIWGYTTAPFRTTATISATAAGAGATNQGWLELVALGTAAAHARLIQDILDWKQSMIADRQYGPYTLYIPTAYEAIMDLDYIGGTGYSGLTIRERILQIEGIRTVTVLDYLKTTDGSESGTAATREQVIMVSLNAEVVRMVEALPLTNMQWTEQGPWMHIFKALTINIPNLRTDQEGHSGILVASEAA
jgi:hypothetical protein